MSARILANALAMSEFQGFSGDCTQTASLCCLHQLNPALFPLTADALDALVRSDIAAGRAAANGAETLDGAAADLAGAGASVEQHGYAEPLAYDWHARLTETAGYQPVLLQVANGAAFGVQSTLHYHAVAVLGADPDTMTYYVADGDNPACAGGRLVGYSLAQLYAARPCGMLVVGRGTIPNPAPPLDLAALRAALAALQADAAKLAALLGAA